MTQPQILTALEGAVEPNVDLIDLLSAPPSAKTRD